MRYGPEAIPSCSRSYPFHGDDERYLPIEASEFEEVPGLAGLTVEGGVTWTGMVVCTYLWLEEP